MLSEENQLLWCIHGPWLGGNFGDDLLRIAAEHVVKASEKSLGKKIEVTYSNPVFLGGDSCSDRSDLHIFWSGTQHFFHL